jgi:cytochrome c5
MNRTFWFRMGIGGLLLSTAISLAQDTNTQGANTKTGTINKQSVGTSQDPGEKAFQANCSRCHSAPEQISPRIAGTVVRHMRVRASLSAKDAQAILRYLAP